MRMKLPRFSLRTMLIVVAIIAAGVGYLRYYYLLLCPRLTHAAEHDNERK
jgi:hypothetical protein